MSELKVNLLKITENHWYVVLNGITIKSILDILSNEGGEKFKKNNMEHIINDKDGQPDILKASEIIYRYSQPEKILFELYETF